MHAVARSDLLQWRPEGLYCPAGDFHIDPWRPVPRAIITHGHADHARIGMGQYYCAIDCLPVLQWRLGDQHYHPRHYSEAFTLGAARLSLHPAGHVLGSAQVRVEVDGEVWVLSGDYKRQPDPTCAPFQPVRCDTFITEATFALPVYRWPDTAQVVAAIVDWLGDCERRGEAAVLYCYALGKAQRLLAELRDYALPPVLLHGAVANGVEVYRDAGIELAASERLGERRDGEDFAGRLVLAPPSAAGSAWLRRFGRLQQGFASGWMRLRGNRRRRNYDRGFVLSDHADWPALLRSIDETGATRVIATHGDSDALVRYLRQQGLNAGPLVRPVAASDTAAPEEGR